MEGFITVGTFASEAETNSVSRDMNPAQEDYTPTQFPLPFYHLTKDKGLKFSTKKLNKCIYFSKKRRVLDSLSTRCHSHLKQKKHLAQNLTGGVKFKHFPENNFLKGFSFPHLKSS